MTGTACTFVLMGNECMVFVVQEWKEYLEINKSASSIKKQHEK